MIPAGRDGGIEIAFPHLVRRRAMLRRLADDGYPLAWTLARQVILDGYEERRLNTGERRRWFLRWWAGA